METNPNVCPVLTKPTLFVNGGYDNGKAEKLVLDSGLPIKIIRTTDPVNNPKIVNGYAQYIGLEKIHGFVNRCLEEQRASTK